MPGYGIRREKNIRGRKQRRRGLVLRRIMIKKEDETE